MNSETILLIIFLACVVGVLLYICFSKVRKASPVYRKESPFLGSENTNCYIEGITIYENLHKNDKKAQFKGDHKRHA